MTDLASQSHIISSKPQVYTPDALITSLDNSLTRYLRLLDQYQTARLALHKNLSSGFLELAQANFKNPNRIHYGQDFYDERMQATVHASISEVKPRFSVFRNSAAPKGDPASSEKPVEPEDAHEKLRDAGQKPSTEESETATGTADPLRWFGVLIPQALRQAQQSFRSVVLEDVGKVLNIRLEMGELEQEIRDARQKIKERSLLT